MNTVNELDTNMTFHYRLYFHADDLLGIKNSMRYDQWVRTYIDPDDGGEMDVLMTEEELIVMRLKFKISYRKI